MLPPIGPEIVVEHIVSDIFKETLPPGVYSITDIGERTTELRSIDGKYYVCDKKELERRISHKVTKIDLGKYKGDL